ncbi:MAG: hypothetical protein KAR20_22895 [Candidatus Heimdallarchaeota archaeon]|nr:hypothetical protein [Candidatus Heimdallarchaeota archaeon]
MTEKSKTRQMIDKVDKNPEEYGTTQKRVKEVDRWIAEADGKKPKKKRGKN